MTIGAVVYDDLGVPQPSDRRGVGPTQPGTSGSGELGRLWGMEGPCANAALGLVDARARLSPACERCQRLSPS